MNRRMQSILVAFALVAPASASALDLPSGVDVGVPRAPALEMIDQPAFVPGDLLVGFEPSLSPAHRRAIANTLDGRIAATIENLSVARIEVADVTAALRLSRGLNGIRFAERNRVGSIASELLPDDRCFGTGCGVGRLWNLDAINAPAGWAVYPGTFYSQTAKAALVDPVKIAVLDTKLDFDRHDWRNLNPGTAGHTNDARFGGQIAITDAADFVSNAGHSGTAAYHGTFVAGLLGASANNTTDVAGVAYHAQIVPIAVVDGNGGVAAFDLASGIDHAVNVGARVINMSLGMGGPSQSVELAIGRAYQHNAVLVAAAGNNGNDLPFYPAWYSLVMSVTASAPSDRPASCTNFSSRTSVAAPGAEIVGLDPRTTSGTSLVPCGTSTATPHVSGLAALLIAQSPGRSALDIRRIIEESADDDTLRPGRDHWFGHGRINVERALRYGQPVATVDRLGVSIPANTGGPANATAMATAVASTTILEAELFVGRLGALGTGIAMTALDGSFDSVEERVRATISTTAQQASGAYRVWVRARTATGWGPASTTALLVDRSPPLVMLDSSMPVVAVSEVSQPASVSFRATDDFGILGTVRYEVRRWIDGAVIATGPTKTLAFGEQTSVEWHPAIAVDAGMYNLVVIVTDEAGNPGQAIARVVVT